MTPTERSFLLLKGWNQSTLIANARFLGAFRKLSFEFQEVLPNTAIINICNNVVFKLAFSPLFTYLRNSWPFKQSFYLINDTVHTVKSMRIKGNFTTS